MILKSLVVIIILKKLEKVDEDIEKKSKLFFESQ